MNGRGTNRPHLSKSRVVACWQCPRYLWWSLPKDKLTDYVGSLSRAKLAELARSLTIALELP